MNSVNGHPKPGDVRPVQVRFGLLYPPGVEKPGQGLGWRCGWARRKTRPANEFARRRLLGASVISVPSAASAARGRSSPRHRGTARTASRRRKRLVVEPPTLDIESNPSAQRRTTRRRNRLYSHLRRSAAEPSRQAEGSLPPTTPTNRLTISTVAMEAVATRSRRWRNP